jgi:lysine 2,3-aminomutase
LHTETDKGKKKMKKGGGYTSGSDAVQRRSQDKGEAPPLRGRCSGEQWHDWKWQMRNRITTPDALLRALPGLSRRGRMWKEGLRSAARLYRMAITPYYLDLVDPGDPDDPIARQALPSGLETLSRPWEGDDPLDEEADARVTGLTHRYPDRALMVTTNLCAMYCRHCTRKREWRSPEGHAVKPVVDGMIDYIRAHTEIRDVIVSGGDPLILPTGRLNDLLQSLREIPHVEIIRIGTRVPVVLPMRIDERLLEVLDAAAPVWINTQFNHPKEITEESAAACEKLVRAGVPMGNQTVLLRGVNDCPSVMTELCRSLLKIRVRPYYLYQCDPVKGVGHFRTAVGEGIRIIEAMRGHTSGLAIPQFVIDAPGGAGKIPVGPNYLLADTGSHLVLRNFEGIVLKYENPPAADHSGCPRCARAGFEGVASLAAGGKSHLIPEGTHRIKRRKHEDRDSI